MTDGKYDRLCDRQPRTLKGRSWLASYLIRNGRACTRLYDNWFELNRFRDGAAPGYAGAGSAGSI